MNFKTQIYYYFNKNSSLLIKYKKKLPININSLDTLLFIHTISKFKPCEKC